MTVATPEQVARDVVAGIAEEHDLRWWRGRAITLAVKCFPPSVVRKAVADALLDLATAMEQEDARDHPFDGLDEVVAYIRARATSSDASTDGA